MSVEIIGVSEKDAPLTLIGKIAGTSTDKSESGDPVKRAKSCIRRGHMSVAEFVTVTFSVTGSRAMTHQLVRHRLASFCVSGDTMLRLGDGYKKKSIADIYNMAQQYKDMILVRCVDENTGLLNYDHFTAITDMGIKPVYEVTTDFGYKVKTTADHLFLCEDGTWKKLSDLSVGDRIMVNGEPLYRDKDWLYEQYWTNNKSQAEIAEMCGVGKDCIRKWVSTFNITKPMGSWTIGVEPPNKGKTKDNYEPLMRSSIHGKGKHSNPESVKHGPERAGWKGDDAADSSKRGRVYRNNVRTGICQNCGFHGATEFHHVHKNLSEYMGENIQELCHACQKAIHKQETRERIIPNKIVSIAPAGNERVYDISMAGEHHNFIGNGFVLHNCQVSQRYCKVDTDDMDWFVTPPSIDECDTATPNGSSAKTAYEAAMASAALQYKNLLAAGVKPEDARYVLPNACMTTIRVSMNLRELQSFYRLRSDRHAQWEIRDVAEDVKERLAEYTKDSAEWQELIDLLLTHEDQK